MIADVPTFAACAFDRVFDVEPKQEFLTLPQLTTLLRRFEVKPKVRDQAERDVRRVDKAWEAWAQGVEAAGPVWPKLKKAAKKATDAGDDPHDAAQQRYQYLRAEAVRSAKKDFRLWAPALYKPNSRRGSENVVYLSCLVLDYDDGTPIEDASETWEAWFHIVHSTWSHSAAHHKFRVVVPLAQPVPAKHWRQVWHWAEDLVGAVIDPACKGEGHAFALPVVPDVAHPREAFSRPGPLLDPVLEGVVPTSAERKYWPIHVAEPLLVGSRKHHYFLHEPDGSAVDVTQVASWAGAVGAVGAVDVEGPAEARDPADAGAAMDMGAAMGRAETVGASAAGDTGAAEVGDAVDSVGADDTVDVVDAVAHSRGPEPLAASTSGVTDPWEDDGVWDDFGDPVVGARALDSAAPEVAIPVLAAPTPARDSVKSLATVLERLEQALNRFGARPSIADQLERVARLREQGMLSDAEFNRAKARILEGE